MEDREELLDELLDSVSDWFYENCNEDGYDSWRDRLRDLQAMADKANDMMVDDCINQIEDQFDVDIDEEFRDEIEEKLADLCSMEL